MKVFIVLALTLATVSGQFGFNPFRLFGGRRPSRPASRPAPRPTSFRTAPATAPAPSSGGARSCNQGFHVSSQHFSWQGARNYCTSNGMRASSLETKLKLAPLTIWFVPLNISGLVEVLTMEDVLLAGPMAPHQPQIGHPLAGKILFKYLQPG